MQIRPLYDRIIVKRIDPLRQTASGIVIPDTATEKPEQGEVMAVGTGRLLQDGSVRPQANASSLASMRVRRSSSTTRNSSCCARRTSLASSRLTPPHPF